MTPYLLFFCISAIPSLFYLKAKNPIAWVLAGLAYVIFLGLRHEVGGDWGNYLAITDQISRSSLLESMRSLEPLFGLVTWISAGLGMGVYGANVFNAALFTVGLFCFCNRFPNRWLALASATPFLVIVTAMSANRQAVAIGIILLLVTYWSQLGIARRALIIALAGMFHTSAIFLMILVVNDLKIRRIQKIVLMVLFAVFAVWLASRSEMAWERYTTIYVHQTHGAYAPGAMLHVLLNAVPAMIFLLFRRSWSGKLHNWELMRGLSLLSVALLAISSFMTVAAGRMSLYLFPISIAFFGYLPQYFTAGASRALVRMVAVVALGAVLVVWMTNANTAFTFIPYRNALFLDSSELALP
jgi:hypothetical protein